MIADQHYRCAFEDVFGSKYDESQRTDMLQKLFSGSFFPAFLGAAFARKQLNQHAKAADGYCTCCCLLETLSPHSAQHCQSAAEWAMQEFHRHQQEVQAGAPSIAPESSGSWSRVCAAAQNARRCHAVFYGPSLWSAQTRRLGWQEELVQASNLHTDKSFDIREEDSCEEMDSDEGEVERITNKEQKYCDQDSFYVSSCLDKSDAHAWSFVRLVAEEKILISITLPPGIQLSELSINISQSRVEVLNAHRRLEVELPKCVKAERAPPAVFRRTPPRLLLHLPL